MKRKVAKSKKRTVKSLSNRRSHGAAQGKRPIDEGVSDGEASIRKYIASLPPWQREIATRFDKLVARRVTNVARVIKWGLPFYGVPGRGWFVSCGGFAKAVKITFFQGVSLNPVPPSGDGRQVRCIDVGSRDDFDEALVGSWVQQAAALPGFGS